MNHYRPLTLILPVFSLLLCACERFLAEIPDRALAIPTTVAQYGQLLNVDRLYAATPTITDFSLGELDIPYTLWNSSNARLREAYVWTPDPFTAGTVQAGDWNGPYEAVYYANVVLDGLPGLETGDAMAYGDVKGRALFLRAFQHLLLQEIYGQPYRPATAGADLGIPLKLTADVEAPIVRATVAETLDRITADAREALDLVSAEQPSQDLFAASKAAVAALLARAYLIRQDYAQALHYADVSLGYHDRLLDFNGLPATYRFTATTHPEILFYCQSTGNTGIFTNVAVTASAEQVELYEAADLRLRAFLKWNAGLQAYNYHAFYTGQVSPFTGLATDEVYLIRAECRARLGDGAGALDDLNALRFHRYETGAYAPLAVADVPDVLGTVLQERRRELVFRGTRWSDLRRLNQDPRFAVTLRRELDGQVYTLPPNDPRYAQLIPPTEVQFSNLIQNAR